MTRLPTHAPHDWLVPDWPAPAGVRAVCTTRLGGVSAGPYASLNLGDHVGDDARHVRANRDTFAHAIGARPVFLKQVHGARVQPLDGSSLAGCEADAVVTGQRLLACTIMVADCLPLLLADSDGRVVAAAHAGWRGLASGVFESVFKEFQRQVSANQQDFAMKREATGVLAWLGPCIGPEAFEVGTEVRNAFLERNAMAGRHFRPHGDGRYLADLAGLARQTLQTLGVHHTFGNDSSAAWCTVSNPSRFFSHRRDRVSGRFAAAIWRV